jgi:hypothetical protein
MNHRAEGTYVTRKYKLGGYFPDYPELTDTLLRSLTPPTASTLIEMSARYYRFN